MIIEQQRHRYNSLYELAQLIADRTTRDTVENLLDSGRVNADDTVYAEKAVPESEWFDMVKGSVTGLMACDEPTPEVVAWFAAHGITY
jgi:hypothetical protein